MGAISPDGALKKIAILTTATGPYFDTFFRDFEASVFDILAPSSAPMIFCFTDQPAASSERTKIMPVKHLGWPFASLMRFHFMQDIAEELRAFDFVLAMDSDMRVVKPFEPHLFEQDLVAVLHPSFDGKVHRAPFEIDSESEAYLPPAHRRAYVQGCFFGGKPAAFNHLTQTLKDMISRELARGIVPIWHDESYLNWFFANHAYQSVSPAYALPEQTRLKFDPFVIHREKPHHEIRKTEVVLDWTKALDPAEHGDLMRQMYLRAHEKTQRLERSIIRSKGLLGLWLSRAKDLLAPSK